mgnify:CR=1 FL=1
MIKFFRRIRYNLMEQNKTGKYFKYAIGEIALVVIGILIALQINNNNEAKKDRAFELKMLKELSIALKSDINYISNHAVGYRIAEVEKSVDYFNWTILRCLNILGTRFTMEYLDTIPKNVPIIIVSNHQSMWDIPPIIWYLRKLHPKFVSKIELGKGIPAISYNLRHGGSILIDRKNPKQALGEMMKFGKYLVEYNRSGVIFPEGTRSRDGKPKRFKTKGLKVLIEHTPNALVLPVTINNSWKTLRYGKFPLGIGAHLKFNVHSSLAVKDFTPEKLIELVEKQITEAITYD